MIAAALLNVTALAVAGTAASPTLAAAAAFEAICLQNAASLTATRAAATAAPWLFEPSGTLPAYGGKSIESFKSPSGLELALRADKKGFGCMVLYTLPDGEPADAVAAAITALPGLTVASAGKGNDYRATWAAPAAPPGSKVLLTIYGKMTPRAPIITLESKGEPR